MAESRTPFDAAHALIESTANATADVTHARRAAYRLGEASAEHDLTIEETFQLLEREAGDILTDLSAEILGSIVRGYVDRIVRTRGVTRSRSAGRLSSHVARLAALHRINRAATGSLHLDAMLSTVVEVVAETIQGDACSVWLSDDMTQTLMLRATVGLNPGIVGRLTIRADAGITGLAATERRTQIAVDAPHHPAFFTYPHVGEDPYSSQVSIPLLLREPERLVGVMNIQTIEPRDFDEDEITFLETAAGELAIAIENARLYSQTDAALNQRLTELHVLQSVTRSIVSTLQPDTLLPMIAEQAAHIIGGGDAAIYRVDISRDPPAIQVLASATDGRGRAVDEFPLDFVTRLCSSRSAMVLNATTPAEHGELLFGAPLMTRHGVLGAICVTAPAGPNHHDERLRLFQAFADSAALALENSDLYDEARRNFHTASVLLQEMHHRVRNNLQTVAALLSMQARYAGYAEWTAPLQEAVARVQSIAAVHNLLSGDSLTSTTVSAIAKQVADEATVNVVPPELSLKIRVEPDEVAIPSRQATILALLINECLTNAIEHGMRDRTTGEVVVSAALHDGIIEVAIADDGNGLPPDFDLNTRHTLGLRIARTLAVSDLKGTFELQPGPLGGARSVIRFPQVADA
ncbi:MAG: histidine kinase [Chloroflexi bacterium]|nr:MAG: histidine kinase [Chloroflexota bacterium]